MELTAAIAVLVAVVAPFAVAVITRPDWSADKKRTTAIIVSVVLGIVVAIATGQVAKVPVTVVSWVQYGVIVVGGIVSLAQGFYKALQTPVTALEAATTPAVAPVAAPTATAISGATVVDIPGQPTTTTPRV